MRRSREKKGVRSRKRRERGRHDYEDDEKGKLGRVHHWVRDVFGGGRKFTGLTLRTGLYIWVNDE